jgi:hypothetical protein
MTSPELLVCIFADHFCAFSPIGAASALTPSHRTERPRSWMQRMGDLEHQICAVPVFLLSQGKFLVSPFTNPSRWGFHGFIWAFPFSNAVLPPLFMMLGLELRRGSYCNWASVFPFQLAISIWSRIDSNTIVLFSESIWFWAYACFPILLSPFCFKEKKMPVFCSSEVSNAGARDSSDFAFLDYLILGVCDFQGLDYCAWAVTLVFVWMDFWNIFCYIQVILLQQR